MHTSPVRFGVLGTGRIVQRGFLPAAKICSNMEIAAIASERPGVAEEIAEQQEISTAYSSYEQLLADSRIDAVYIPATGEKHHRWTLATARAGKHVLCEKPLATTLDEAEEMIAVCRDAGVILQEAFMWRHHPRALKARELVQDGVIGELRLVNASFSFDIDRGDWRMDPERGGGAMWDLGCYGVNAARYFTGEEPGEIYSHAGFHETGVDMTMQIALAFPQGTLANVDCSFEVPFRCYLELVGTKGRIELPNAFQPCEEDELLLYESTKRFTAPRRFDFAGVNQYGAQLAAFCKSVHAGQLQPPAENGWNNMQAMIRVLEFARSNRRP